MKHTLRILTLAIFGFSAAYAYAELGNIEIRGNSLNSAIKRIWSEGTVEMPPASPLGNTSSVRIQVKAHGVDRKGLIHTLLTAAGMEGTYVGEVLWVKSAGEEEADKLTLRDIEGFEILKVGKRNILKEVREREEGRLDPLTRAYLKHRRMQDKPKRNNDVRGGNSYLGVRLATPGSRAVPNHASVALRRTVEKWDGWGALILEVVPESPSAYSGLIAGDTVVKFAGLWVESASSLIRMVSRAESSREIEIEVLRDGLIRREYVVIGERPVPKPAAPQR